MDAGTKSQGTPLAGVKILEFSGLGPTPFGTMLLCDLGAEAIRIERAGASNPLGGDARFDFLYRGRPAIHLDLKSEKDRDVARALAQQADVLIEGFRPGTMERLGLGPDDLTTSNEGLIYARMSGWGQDGPLRDMAGHDINYLAQCGALYPVGPMDGPPTPPINLVGNFGGGGTFLAIGVLAAMAERTRSGKGQVLDVAMSDGIIVLLTQLMGWKQMGQWRDGRGGNLLDGSAYFYRCYETSDGRHLAVGALEKPFHDAFIEGLGLQPADFSDHLNPANWPERGERIHAIIAEKSLEEWCGLFAGRDACVTPVLSVEEAAESELNRERGMFVRSKRSYQSTPAPRFSRSSVREPHQTVETDRALSSLSSWNLDGIF
ncbi:CoA transferase [Porphyrobacter algicida]|uniref:CoA transferase n=1 Tax=Qipengyuania algicida TaxID=1836209 RepID=A0A845AKS5_9SPHN|nr:CaiB/BaiF CoA-transferase family protein [Qipengyuania algicida]MXP29455.1 CoA transferase [Qipengyuania algicida]